MPYTLQIHIVEDSPSTMVVDKHVEKFSTVYKTSYNVAAFSLLPKKMAVHNFVITPVFLLTIFIKYNINLNTYF